jgi:gliding motility-associated-like protein
MTSVAFDDAFIVKLDVNGQFIWAKQLGGSNYEFGEALGLDGAGNIYTTGYFQGTVDFDPGPAVFNMTSPGTDVFISKLDPGGNFIWAKQFSGSTQVFPNSIVVNASGEMVVVGNFRNTMDIDPGPGVYNITAQDVDVFTVKLNSSGSFQWGFKFGGAALQDHGRCVTMDASGNVFITGNFSNIADFDPGPGVQNFTSIGGYDIYVAKYDAAGALIWVKQIGSTDDDVGYGIYADGTGNVYVTGDFMLTADFNPGPAVYNMVSAGNEDAFVLKLSNCAAVTYSTLNVFSCDPYTLNGQTYSSTGSYTQVLVNTAGCDSILTLNLVIGGSTTNLSATSCDSYTWQGQTFTSSGNYSVILTGADGCDSVLNLALTINYSVTSTINASICDGQSYAGHTLSGTYVDIFTAANGCDSIRTLILAVRPRSFTTISQVICEGQSFAGHNTTGTFIETFTGVNGCDSIRTLNLLVNPRKFTNINATICVGQTYYAGGANQTNPGIYRDTLVSSTGCDSIIATNLTVNPKPNPYLGSDRSICTGSSLSLNPGNFATYLWQDNSTQSIFIASIPGSYWVNVTNNFGCNSTDSMTILSINPVPGNFLKASDSICSYSTLKITPLNNYANYLWSDGSIASSITVPQPGLFWLQVTDLNGCLGKDSIVVYLKDCIKGVFVPTAFTPNNDGKNDVFRALVYGKIVSFKLEVYDRAGQIVFRSTNPLESWNGLYGGTKNSTTVFVWQCYYQLEGSEPGYQKGTVTIIK